LHKGDWEDWGIGREGRGKRGRNRQNLGQKK